MLKNKILLAFVALLFGTTLNAQSIIIDDARLLDALPAGGSYGSGSTVAVPVTLNGCFAQNNVFTWKLYNGAVATGDSGKITAFYITFMNVTLPIGLATGSNYNIQIKATTVGSTPVNSANFPVTNVATPVIAKATPVFSDFILRDEYYFGICDGNAINSMSLRDSSTAGGTDSLELVNNYKAAPSIKFTPSAGKFNLLFNPIFSFGKSRDAYYTAFLKSISPTNIVSTKAYHIINNSWDINTYVEAKSFSYSCSGDTVLLVYVNDFSQSAHIQQNFPGALIKTSWSDGTNITLSQCEILAANGKIKHYYDKGSCEAPNQNTNYKITSTVNNPFYVFNGNGITATCAAGAENVTSTSIFTKPKASFRVDSVVCANDTIKFRNFSNPGQGVANIGSSLTCAQLANYTWVIDGNLANPLYQTQPGKVEPRKDTAYVFNSNQPGFHTVRLYINNNYGNFSPCPASDTLRTFCVDTAKVRPEFQMDSAGTGILKDSIIGCAPVFCIKNTTKRTFCVDTTQFNYYWRVLDATSPGPKYTEVPVNVNYSFTSGGKNSKSPCISINKTGKYFIELMASASCAIDSSLAVRKYVEANGDAGVNFPTGTDTVKYCMISANEQLTINYSPLAPINPQLNIRDTVNYVYQSSAGGALSYLWTVTPGVLGVDYDFVNGPSDSIVRYPQIRIRKPGLYKVTVKFSNNCQPKTAIQYIAFREPVKASAGTNVGITDSICHTTNTFNITGASASTVYSNGPVGEIFWTTSGDGFFNPQSGTPGTPNIFNPVYTPGPNDKAISCSNGFMFTLTMSVIGIQPQNCAVVSAFRKLYIRPCVTVADTAFNSCSGTSVNYSIKQPGLVGSTFTWTSSVEAGSINPPGPSNNAIGSNTINDVLIGNGIVKYILLPQKDGCVGNSFTVTDTVRPIPNQPIVNLVYPSNSTHSMCSGDTAIIQLSSSISSDQFNWTSYNYVNKITGNSTGTDQSGPIQDVLINTQSPLQIDSVTYVVRTNSVYGCAGGLADSVTVVVTPGPNVAATVDKLRLLCGSSCDSLKANIPGPAGKGYWSIKNYLPNPKPTFSDSTSNNTQVCGLVNGVDYYFYWNIDPLLAGCNSTYDSVRIVTRDTLTAPNAGNDTAFCDADAFTLKSIPLKGLLSRNLVIGEYYQWRIISGPVGGSVNPVQSLNTTLFFKEPGVYAIGFFTANYACTNKEDTVLVRVFGKPKGGSFTVSPSQGSYCQGTPMTLTANIDTKYDTVAYWKCFESPYNGNYQNEGFNQNPYSRPGANVKRSEGIYAVLYSKGWNYGCKDSTLSTGAIVYVDSTTISGSISSPDSIICTANSVVKLDLKGNRGAVLSWVRSSVGPNGPYTSFAIGNPVSVAVPATTWYRAIVQNGACTIDTTLPFRVFLPTGTDAAKAGSDTILCGADTFRLSGNVPVVGNGYWKLITGLINNPATYPGNVPGVFTFDATTNNTTTNNPVVANISQYGVYQFVWTIKNLTCDATADTVTIVNTQPIGNNSISSISDTVCNGTKVNLTGSVTNGGGSLSTYIWQYSTNSGASWTLGSNAALSYTFTATTDVWVRRVVKSDSCTDYGNTIKFVVQPTLTNNVITPALNAVCINTLAPNITGSLPTGGSGAYTYTWNYGNNIDTANKLWINPNVNNQNYNPVFNLTDTIHIRRIVVSGKCTDTSAISTIIVYPDAKANFISSAPNGNTRCAPYNIGGDITNIILPNTNYDWYITTSSNVRTLINSGNQFSGYTILNGLDNVKLTLIATSTTIPACKTDSMSMTFNTSATPTASFTISANLGCADNTGTKATNFIFTNTTPNKALFTSVNWNLNSSTLTNSGLIDLPSGGFQFKPSTTGLDTVYTISLTVNSPSCGSSQYTDTIRIRTRPKVSFALSPTYQCSGGIVTFTNQTVGSPNLTWNWVYGDATLNDVTPNTTHTYNVGSLTTYIPTLTATNECASDSAKNSVVIAANTVKLNISVKGTDKYKCLPDTVTFYSNSTGGTSYFWDFGDGSLTVPSTNDKDTVIHIYKKSGTFIVSLTGSTTCGSVTKTDSIFAYGTPIVAYSIAPNTTACKGDTLRFTNLTDTATNYVWNFGNGTGGGVNPTRTYANSGVYSVKLTATRFHTLPLGGVLGCTDTSSLQSITIRDTMPASFSITPLGASCLPYAVQFSNTTNITTLPIGTTDWTFGYAGAQSSGNPVSYTYNQLGQYNVNLTVTNAGNCTYIDSQKVTVAGPIGTWTHDTGYICGNTPVNFQINASSTDSITINYGDATPVVTVPFSTFPNPFTHVYKVGGNYTPTVTLKSVNGCTYFIAAFGTIRVDYVKAGYTINTPVQNCGNTVQGFTNTTTMNQAPLAAVYSWNINGVAYPIPNPSVTFNTTGVYNVRMQVTSISGCFDSVATAPLFVKVNNIPNILSITRQDTACAGQSINYTAVLSPSEDPINNYNWNYGNGTTGSGISSQTIYGATGIFTDTLTVVTSKGCTSTLVRGGLVINTSPVVSISPSKDTLICAGSNLTLTASGANTYNWSPNIALVPNITSQVVTVSPPNLTKYVVTGFNLFGCSDTSSIRVSTVNDYAITISASPNDSLCKGDSISLTVVGAPSASSIIWSPGTGITTSPTAASVMVKPNFTTQYTVTVNDSAFCFPHIETVWVGVGDTTTISLGLDTVYLQGGTVYPLTPSVVNGPIGNWNWTPATNLSCSDCGNPIATVKSNVCYNVEATSIYGCKAYADICIIAFCEASQVFIPNAFTPDGDGVNDYLWIKARGIKSVKSFRIFNRWGQVVFERANFTPVDYDRINSWDGKIKGVIAPTEVYVYTCEVICENGTKFTYTGNIAVIK